MKIRDEATVRSKRSTSRMTVSDLKSRGCHHLLIEVTGLKGVPEALGAFYPQTTLQTSIHLIRQMLDFANWKEEADGERCAPRSRRHWGTEFPMAVPAALAPGRT